MVFDPKSGIELHKLSRELRSEFVICIKGKVRARINDAVNHKIATGEIEINGCHLEILNRSETPPFEINESENIASIEIRLKYRYLDLRRAEMQKKHYI